MPLPQQDAPLHDLLQRMLKLKQALSDDWQPHSGLNAERTVVIREISHSEFAAAADEVATTRAMPHF